LLFLAISHEPVGLSCEEQEQNCAPPNPSKPYASESYDAIYGAVEKFVRCTVEHPPMPLDPAEYPKHRRNHTTSG
jgi:hypothetical protein